MKRKTIKLSESQYNEIHRLICESCSVTSTDSADEKTNDSDVRVTPSNFDNKIVKFNNTTTDDYRNVAGRSGLQNRMYSSAYSQLARR